jgi:iron complex transport system ATP-binding protein
VLQDVDLELRTGECLSLIGPNGAGKTTLLLALLGLLPPAAGHVRLDGVDVRRLPPRARGCWASYVPQVAERLPAFRIYDVVTGGRYPHLSPLRPLGDEDQAAVGAALAQCGLTELAQRPVDAVSGGERQKTLIAAAIAQDAEVMFLDEPATALDPKVQVELLDLLRGWRRRGRGIVLISHDLNLPGALGGRVVALSGGRVVGAGSAAEMLRPERLAEVYGTAFDTARTVDGRTLVLPRWWGASGDEQ